MSSTFSARGPLLTAAVLLVGLLAGCASSQSTTAPSPDDSGQAQSPAQNETGENGLKPFGDVVPDTARTDPGLLTTHRFDGKLYVEIPDSLIGRELLMVSRAAQTPDGFGYGGEKTATQVLRWQRRGDQLYLRVVSHEDMAQEDDPVYQAVQNSNLEPIIQSFSIEALNEDSTGVVAEVTDLFTSDVPSLGIPSAAREEYRVRRLDGDRTYIKGVESFPENTDIEAVLTYQAENPPSNASTKTLTVSMNHSMVLLPKEPMQPRLCDDRVGYFSVERVNYSSDEQRATEACFITRRWKRWAEERGIPFEEVEAVQTGRPAIEVIEEVAPHLDPEAEIDRLGDEMAADTEGVEAFDGAKALLDRLPEDRWAIATSGRHRTATARMTHVGLPEPEVFVTADDVEQGKPAPEPYQQAATGLGIDPGRCVVLEDAPAGVASARRAGASVLGVATSTSPNALAAATAVIPHVEALDVRAEEAGLRVDWQHEEQA